MIKTPDIEELPPWDGKGAGPLHAHHVETGKTVVARCDGRTFVLSADALRRVLDQADGYWIALSVPCTPAELVAMATAEGEGVR